MSTSSAAGEFGWVAEWLTQFLKSPVWTTPVQSFIDENCEPFDDADEEENKLVFTTCHKEFAELVDKLLSDNLSDMGVPEEAFLRVIGSNTDLDSLVKEYLLSMDDFPTFRKMMEKRNVELELEALSLAEQYRGQDCAYSEEDESALMKMAIEASVQDHVVLEKQLQMEDAELQHALAISVAAEEERQRQREEEIKNEVADTAEQHQKVQEAKMEHEAKIKQIEEEVLAARIEVVKKVPAVQQAPPPAPQPQAAPPAEPQAPPASLSKPASEIPAKSRPTAQTATLDKVQLAPLVSKGAGGSPLQRKAPLPGITASSKPSFEALKTAVQASPPPPQPVQQSPPQPERTVAQEPTEEELKKRAEYLRAQRDRLVKKKKEQRQNELQDYLKDKAPPPPERQDSQQQHDASLEMRKALARRVKEDLLSSS